ncbi:pyridoxal 5'-phosphate synthase glutaminase subunit PdxT [Clostridium vincentii]|uniref:Pyridoxal 5'-phosphate synthase subunit PdxT n=1 Tax=Clostridium vincentii TaxID=52704 RepID=A0A2T0B8I3_9CLOT|nr:pyridoxal 5'-phosphate synthase glutaminase subunit PdxT [Clostridium vincentii]PRR80196.1 Glutamine amidotransferase subunit PdxT [Clostridium vincentii]
MIIGVLSLQGDVIEHINHIKKTGYIGVEVKTKQDIDAIDALILPGGESTAIGRLLRITELEDYLKQKIINGLPVWGTCAGMILLAKNIDGEDKVHLGIMNIKVKRNAYGTQLDSFIIQRTIENISKNPIDMIFIRAPYIEEFSETVTPLIYVDGNLVAAKENNILVTSFHPELTDNTTFLNYFINEIC